MKKTNYIILCFALCCISACRKDNSISIQQPTPSHQLIPIPNGDFESWTYLRLQYWETNSCPFCLPPFETYIVRQDSDAFQGLFAAKFIYNNVYPATADNKFSVSSHPINLSARVKCNLFGTDTVLVKIKLLNNSIAVDSGEWFGTSSINSYTLINIPVSQNSLQCDSAIISIQGGHKLGYPSNNTEFWVDDLQLY